MNIEDFMNAFSVHTQSTHTLRAYREDLERFQNFLQSKKLRVTQVKAATIIEYIQHLRSNAGRTRSGELAPATVVRRLAVLSCYYEFLREQSNGKIRNPFRDFRKPKVDNDLPRAIDENRLSALIEGISVPRDRSILLLLLYSGLRLAELQRLDVDTIRIVERQLPNGSVATVGEGEVLGKGNKTRRFLVALEALTGLASYLQTRPQSDDPALFLSDRRRRLSCRSIQQVLQKWCSRLGLEHINIHALRHSFCHRMVNAGMPSAVLMELMSHSSFSTTQRYFRIRPDRLSREYHAAMEFVRQAS